MTSPSTLRVFVLNRCSRTLEPMLWLHYGDRWLIVAFHEPTYTTQSSPQLGVYFKEHLEQLFYNNAVDIVVSGHIHAYERSFPVFNGVVRARLCYLTQTLLYSRRGTTVTLTAHGRHPQSQSSWLRASEEDHASIPSSRDTLAAMAFSKVVTCSESAAALERR